VKKLRIAMVAACPFPAAFASSGLIRELSLALSKKGHDVHVVTYHLGSDDFDCSPLTIHRTPALPYYKKTSSGISWSKPFLDLLLLIKLLGVVKKHQIDIIHTHNYEAPPAGFTARFFFKTPVIYHAHNTMYHELPTYFSQKYVIDLMHRFGRFLDRMIPIRADHTIVLSTAQRDYLLKTGIKEQNLSIVLPGILPGAFQGGNSDIIRDRLNIGSAPLLIYTGGLQPYQNCHLLVEILRRSLIKRPDLHLLIVARSESDELRNTALAAGIKDRIHFLEGAGLEWERDCLAAANIGVIPRRHCIGFPIKLLNYFAAEKPVVCFENLVSGFDIEKAIFSVENGNIEMMVRTILEILDGELTTGSKIRVGKKLVNTCHNWDQSVTEIELIYKKVLNL